MKSNNKEIKNLILEENALDENEKRVVSPIIDFFLQSSVMDVSSWDLETYKKYISFNKQNIIKNPRNIENLDEATSLFIKYIKEKKDIYIITDNDLDGSSANAMAKAVKLYLARRYKKKDIFNVQFAYGMNHGISFQQIDDLMEGDQKEILVITADNGINNREEIIQINNKYPNIKIIITDHHTANKEDHVFDIVDFVINPEAIALDTKSHITELKLNEETTVKTSISGAHTFALLLLNMLDKMKIKNLQLQEEIILIALFSDIGDIINYHLDVHNEITYNMKNFQTKMYMFQHHIDNLSYFDQVPNKNHKDKMRDYFKENITLFNSVRRLNSLLMSINEFSDNDNALEKWFQEHFALDIDTITINQDNLKEFIVKTNDRAKHILEYFGEPLDKKYNFYSYIKSIVPYVLFSNNSLKTEEDKVFIEEIMDIINDLNQLKKVLRLHIVNNELYTTYKKDNFEIYVSNIGSILREILSIQVFIETKSNIPYLNLAVNSTKTEVKGSLRSPSFYPFKHLLLDDKRVEDIKNKHNINIKIMGHTEAAGILFTKTDESNITEQDIFAMFDDIMPILDEEMIKVEKDKVEKIVDMDIHDLANMDVTKLQNVINNYLYIGHHPFFEMPMFQLKLKDLEDLTNSKFTMSISKKGNKFLNKKHKNLSFMYYGDEDRLKDPETIFKTTFSIKYNVKTRSFYIELNLN